MAAPKREITEESLRIGRRIQQARRAAGLTLEELAQQAGVTGATLSRWESGEYQPRDANLRRVAAVLDRSLAWFYSDTDEDQIDALQESLVAIFRRVLTGEEPVSAFESETTEPLRLNRADRQWLTQNAEEFRSEFTRRTGRAIESLSEKEMDTLLREFVQAFRQEVNSSGASGRSVPIR